ncbi:MAG TPA: Lrp/AsnC family transcriptional regulator [Dongiaceae bacterium]|nr:Lrp/AsnC family transcriptional regulator [Dongiaceae bacterium]
MDAIDRKILVELQSDADLPYAELGNRVGLSASAINERLKRLKAGGQIRRLTAEIDPAAFGLDLLAFLLVRLDLSADETAFRTAMIRAPQVLECHHITGAYSYLLKLRLRETADLERFLTTEVKTLPGVAATETIIALSSAKDSRDLTDPEPAVGKAVPPLERSA